MTPRIPVLAIDPAIKTGWAIGTADAIGSGVLDLSSNWDDGRRAMVLHDFLADVMRERRPRLLVIERPFMSRPDANTARIHGLVFVAHMVAAQFGIPRREVAASEYRAAMFGNGRLTRSEAKRLALEWCRTRGYDPSTDDEAEARLILAYWLQHGELALASGAEAA